MDILSALEGALVVNQAGGQLVHLLSGLTPFKRRRKCELLRFLLDQLIIWSDTKLSWVLSPIVKCSIDSIIVTVGLVFEEHALIVKQFLLLLNVSRLLDINKIILYPLFSLLFSVTCLALLFL